MGTRWNFSGKLVNKATQRWILGLVYIVAIAAIWISASYIVQSVVDAGVSPFLVTYICNSLFMIYIPLVEIARQFDDPSRYKWIWWTTENSIDAQQVNHLENVHLVSEMDHSPETNALLSHNGDTNLPVIDSTVDDSERTSSHQGSAFIQLVSSVTNADVSKQIDSKGRWTRTRVAKVSLLICPFWFFAQLAFNLSLKYTTVTVSPYLISVIFIFLHTVPVQFTSSLFLKACQYDCDVCFITSCSLILS